MGVEQLLNLSALLGVAWSVIVYVPKTVLGIYKQIDQYRDHVNDQVNQISQRVDGLESKIESKQLEINHRLDLHVQQTLMSLDRISENIVSISNSLSALHRRLDNESNDKRLG